MARVAVRQRASELSLYECPSLNQWLNDTCPVLAPGALGASVREPALEYACGLVWITESQTSGEKYGFDPSTGELRAAHSFSPAGPVAAPCNTFGVHAGERTACGSSFSIQDSEVYSENNPAGRETCGCLIAQSAPDFSDFACQAMPWYQQLAAAASSSEN